METIGGGNEPDSIEIELPDLGTIDLGALRELDRPVLWESISRVIGAAGRSDDAYSGFTSSI